MVVSSHLTREDLKSSAYVRELEDWCLDLAEAQYSIFVQNKHLRSVIQELGKMALENQIDLDVHIPASYHNVKKERDTLHLHFEYNKNNYENLNHHQSLLKGKLQVLEMKKAALQLWMKKINKSNLLLQQVHTLMDEHGPSHVQVPETFFAYKKGERKTKQNTKDRKIPPGTPTPPASPGIHTYGPQDRGTSGTPGEEPCLGTPRALRHLGDFTPKHCCHPRNSPGPSSHLQRHPRPEGPPGSAAAHPRGSPGRDPPLGPSDTSGTSPPSTAATPGILQGRPLTSSATPARKARRGRRLLTPGALRVGTPRTGGLTPLVPRPRLPRPRLPGPPDSRSILTSRRVSVDAGQRKSQQHEQRGRQVADQASPPTATAAADMRTGGASGCARGHDPACYTFFLALANFSCRTSSGISGQGKGKGYRRLVAIRALDITPSS
ncbi:PREDICTED: uncharacterized protein LOC103610870 [Galeopterus variegatus]|uniref:Uncharacterized protein LOC103610870 n=1 Tax=Galeopterus variegatus TaxID=482537 RepID=A0ABM0SJX3_GALVR|nr:PREDICTED: uncharacterized protein LOC103610870 [Galeopterus variegatus]